jgi:Flp pilus assembly protein TadG
MPCRLSKFASDQRGNFAIISTMLAVPLVMAVGMAIDVTTIASTRSDLQQAIDSAVLAVAREGKDVSTEKADAIARTFLEGNFDPALTKVSVVKSGSEFSVKADTTAGLAFGSLFGYQDWPVHAAASADIAYASYEIALVLDTTGSMKGGKLASMKDAVLGLIGSMSVQVADVDKLKFAVVPFAAFVNVGPTYGPSFTKKGKQVAGSGANWLDLQGQSDVPQSELGAGASRFQIYSNLGQTWPGCVETRYSDSKDYDVDDTPADPAKAETLFIPAFGIDEPDAPQFANSYIKSDAKPKDKSATEKKKRWAKYGVGSDASGQPLLGGLLDPLVVALGDLLGLPLGKQTIKIDTSASTSDGLPKGPGHGCDVQPITPMTNDYASLEAKVNALQAGGTTNITEGVAWGNRVLSPGQPFPEGSAPRTGLEKIMVVLTDGSNVMGNTSNDLGSTYSSQGYLVDGRLGIEAGGAAATNTLMNQRTLKACETAKAAGIEVYTIRLEEPNVATGSMLKECASAPDHYFDVPSRSQLDDAFGAIKQKIVRVRIAS